MILTRAFFFTFMSGLALFGQSTLSCSSDDMRRHYCSADTRSGVQLVRQRSDARCVEGSTWGYDRRGIWVDRGCRADFALGGASYNRGGVYNGNGGYGPYGGYGRNGGNYGNGPYSGTGGYSGATMSCNSDDMRRHYCSTNTSGGVRLVRQHSDASCVEGSTWGYDRRGIWVDRGCRADFQVGGGGSYGNGRYGNSRYGNSSDSRNYDWRRWRPW